MAFPGSNTYTTESALTQLRTLASNLRNNALYVRTQSAAGPLTSGNILAFLSQTKSIRAQMAAVAATPGLAAYASSQYSGSGIDITAEYTAMDTQIGNTIAWIASNFPKDGSSYLLATTMDAQGVTADRSFSTVTLAGFRTVLDALIATIAS